MYLRDLRGADGQVRGRGLFCLSQSPFQASCPKKMQRYSGRGRTENSWQVTQGKERPALSQDIHTVIVDCGKIVRLPEFVKVLFCFFPFLLFAVLFAASVPELWVNLLKFWDWIENYFFIWMRIGWWQKITNNKWNLDQNIFYCVPLTLNWHELNMHCWSEMVINKKKQKTVQTMIWSDRSENNGSAPVSGPICIYDSVHCSLQEFPLIYYQRVKAVSVFIYLQTHRND